MDWAQAFLSGALVIFGGVTSAVGSSIGSRRDARAERRHRMYDVEIPAVRKASQELAAAKTALLERTHIDSNISEIADDLLRTASITDRESHTIAKRVSDHALLAEATAAVAWDEAKGRAVWDAEIDEHLASVNESLNELDLHLRTKIH